MPETTLVTATPFEESKTISLGDVTDFTINLSHAQRWVCTMTGNGTLTVTQPVKQVDQEVTLLIKCAANRVLTLPANSYNAAGALTTITVLSAATVGPGGFALHGVTTANGFYWFDGSVAAGSIPDTALASSIWLLPYGTGFDGDHTAAGTKFDIAGANSPQCGATWNGATSKWVANRDIHLTKGELATGTTLDMNGFILHATGTFTNNGIVMNSGGAGGNAAAETGGAAGTATAAGTLAAGKAGVAGQNNAGGLGNAGIVATASLGGSSGLGGKPGTGADQAAATATALTAAQGYLGASPWVGFPGLVTGTNMVTAGVVALQGGAGGSGGGGGSGAVGPNHGGGGGGSGAGGGPLVVCVRTLDGNGTFQAKGGAGGNGGAAAGSGNGGGGGGGGGFILVVNDAHAAWTGTLDATCVAGGAGGTKGTIVTGTLGADGGTGSAGKFALVTLAKG